MNIEGMTPSQIPISMDHTGPVWSCAMTSYHLTLFSGSNDTSVKIWEAVTQQVIATLNYHSACVNGLVVTDKLLISGL